MNTKNGQKKIKYSHFEACEENRRKKYFDNAISNLLHLPP